MFKAIVHKGHYESTRTEFYKTPEELKFSVSQDRLKRKITEKNENESTSFVFPKEVAEVIESYYDDY